MLGKDKGPKVLTDTARGEPVADIPRGETGRDARVTRHLRLRKAGTDG